MNFIHSGDLFIRPTFYLSLTADERHDLLKLTANESGLFRKVYEASTTPLRSFYDASNLTREIFPYMTGANDKWHAPLPPANPNQHRDSDGRWYELTDNGDKPSGIQYL